MKWLIYYTVINTGFMISNKVCWKLALICISSPLMIYWISELFECLDFLFEKIRECCIKKYPIHVGGKIWTARVEVDLYQGVWLEQNTYKCFNTRYWKMLLSAWIFRNSQKYSICCKNQRIGIFFTLHYFDQ